ncbi:hypothetical protein F5Y16DRAFT_405472 [Xylariaceae sp. FL0255]|nr:hypothetical protein F5Y16DRAFT_405472 [Xylariaceae sp. FL0255]
MDRATALRKQIFENSKPGVFERQPQKRVNSLPLVRRDSWVQKDAIPARCVSLCSKVARNPTRLRSRSRSRTRLQSRQQFLPNDKVDPSQKVEEKDQCYDSDEEDRRNGVPTTYTHHNPSLPTQRPIHEIEAEYALWNTRRAELQHLLDRNEEIYWRYRALFAEAVGRDWNPARWRKFLKLEDNVYMLKAQVSECELEMQCLCAQLVAYNMQMIFNTQSVDGKIESPKTCAQETKDDLDSDVLVLEWKGIDFNDPDL